MEIEITKSEFEGIINVATSAQMQVYEKVAPYVEETKTFFLDVMLEKLTTEDEEIIGMTKKFICLEAFRCCFRQLDLVLTPTGFGVVSNNTTAPASKERVNALYDLIVLERERVYSRLLYLLPKVNGWGDTVSASVRINRLYDIIVYETYAGKLSDIQKWNEAQNAILEIDTVIRKKISDAQMEALLNAMRHNTVTTEQLGAIVLIQKITSLAIARSPLVKERVRGLINYLEQHDTTFSEYLESDEYKINHYERFQNKKDSPGYCFVG